MAFGIEEAGEGLEGAGVARQSEKGLEGACVGLQLGEDRFGCEDAEMELTWCL